ncbi:MAG: RHS repeat-associated core domain-containing protein [Candidatus Kapaibacterium sp.]|jgi:RHS repeat-associated protein
MYDSLDLHHNVRVVSNDIKSRAVSTVPFTTKIYNFANYYPFGMQHTGTAGSYDLSSDYRYGYNGKEKDDEIKGEANSLDYCARIYDPRVGKFLSVDPLTKDYPYLTPYQFASNTPIQAIDLDGLEAALINPSTRNIVIVVQGFTRDAPATMGRTQSAQSQKSINELPYIEDYFKKDPTIQVVVYNSSKDDLTARDIVTTIENFRKDNVGGKVILVGHSMGADNLIEAVNETNSRINLMILMDTQDDFFSYNDTDIPYNVDMAIHYKTTDFIGGETIESKETKIPFKKAQIINITLRTAHTQIDNEMKEKAAQIIECFINDKNYNPIKDAKKIPNNSPNIID